MRFALDPAVRRAWLAGDHAVAARAAGNVPMSGRIPWAVGVVRATLPAVPARSALTLHLARVSALDAQTAWRARALFDQVRDHGLHASSSEEGPLVRLTELACKVVYNATGPEAPFDARSDVMLVEAAAAVARTIPALEDAVWRAVVRR